MFRRMLSGRLKSLSAVVACFSRFTSVAVSPARGYKRTGQKYLSRWRAGSVVLLVLGMLLAGWVSAGAEPSPVAVSDARVRLPIAAQSVTVGYLTLHNTSAQSLQLVAVKSAHFARIEMHQHEHVNGMMRMRKVDGLTVAAGETSVFQPGGLHLMMFEPQGLSAGDKLHLELHFASGLVVPAIAEVFALR